MKDELVIKNCKIITLLHSPVCVITQLLKKCFGVFLSQLSFYRGSSVLENIEAMFCVSDNVMSLD
ncbi:CLUMA_CG013337, isoform A [Clunio marinus]|uniref:CLUMA_CG013337, isoform A n=1 Tax=Clunio marinus TaxID=568069 RepID=A0A1J1INJ6_9DIPT|nr:CLUMA_CG013337, isoform A [Clunio marinus]